MRNIKWVALAALVLAGGVLLISPALQAQARSQNANVTMMDDCSPADGAYNAFGGCPEEAPFPGSRSFKGDVTAAEFFDLLFSPLADPTHVIGHPSWRNEPSYMNVRAGQSVRVTNRGGRGHTFTKVADFGGGFVDLLNGSMDPAPECNPAVTKVLLYGESDTLKGLEAGQLHQFQCCIHPWMRAAIRVN